MPEWRFPWLREGKTVLVKGCVRERERGWARTQQLPPKCVGRRMKVKEQVVGGSGWHRVGEEKGEASLGTALLLKATQGPLVCGGSLRSGSRVSPLWRQE